MTLSRTLRSKLPIAVLAVALLFSVAACQEEAEPAPAPEIDVIDVLTRAAEKVAAISTVKFSLIDEKESGAKFFGATFKSLEAEVKAPDSFIMLVDVEAPGFGFVQISMMAVGEEAFLKLSQDAPWNPLPLDQVPFNFVGLGLTLADLLTAVKDDATATGQESVGDAQAVRIEAELSSDELQSLITTADPGLEVSLTLWIDATDYNLQQIRIAGPVYLDDDPETVRLLSILGIDVPVEIQIPDLGSGS